VEFVEVTILASVVMVKIYANTSKPDFDVCGICAGNGSSCIGCDGLKGVPPKVLDFCGICGGNDTCLGCDGKPYPNTTAPTLDICGICGGDGASCIGCDGKVYQVTLGEIPKTFDLCGICGGNNTCIGCDGKIYNTSAGEFPAVVDLCGVCGGNNLCVGCDGVAVNLALQTPTAYDRCGVCGGNDACVGCDDQPNSGIMIDECGICGGDNSTCVGCDDVPNSGKIKDKCNVCGGNNTCLIIPKSITPENKLSPAGIAGIVIGSVVACLVGILAPVLYFTVNRAVNGANWFLPQDMANKMSSIKNNPLYKGKGPKANPLANRKSRSRD